MSSIIWLGLMIVFIWVEAETVALVSLWFAAGSLAAALVGWFCGGIGFQIGAFAVVSGVLLLLLRPVAKKYFTPKLEKTNIDAIIGAEGLVTKKINNTVSEGQVKINGMEWTARSTSQEPIEEGTQIKVDRIEGVKVYVSPVHTPVAN